MVRLHDVEAQGIALTIDLASGHLRRLRVERDGRTVEPLHAAPWLDEPELAEDPGLPLVLRALSGDFLCAPFAENDVELAPPHGWTANSAWRHVATERVEGRVVARFELDRRVLGARVEKVLTLRGGHPFLYARHVFVGGSGRLPIATHAMTRFGPAGGALAWSPKAWGETPSEALETDPARGRHHLAYPARFEDPRRVPTVEGGEVNLLRYPIGSRHEDFVTLVEAPGNRLGWAVALRHDTQDAILSLKAPAELPVTMLWFSNGGRDYPPWNGRHDRVLGIEEGRSWAASGHRASAAANPFSDRGIATAIDLDPEGEVSIRSVLGAVPIPAGWTGVAGLDAHGGRLVLAGVPGGHLALPYDGDFLGIAG